MLGQHVYEGLVDRFMPMKFSRGEFSLTPAYCSKRKKEVSYFVGVLSPVYHYGLY